MVKKHRRVWQLCQIRLGQHQLLGYAALDWRARAWGLLGLKQADLPAFLWFDRCAAVHTFSMQTAIDIVFLSQDWKILSVHTAVAPWRCRYHWGATSVLELPPQQAHDWMVGEKLHWTLVRV